MIELRIDDMIEPRTNRPSIGQSILCKAYGGIIVMHAYENISCSNYSESYICIAA